MIFSSKEMYRYTRKNIMLMIALLIIFAVVVIAIAGPIIATHDPVKVGDAVDWRQPPSTENIMGTDNYGRDIFSRLVYAARLNLGVGISIAGISFFIGTLVGAVSGYFGGWVDEIVMRIVDIIISFPSFILAMGITAMMGTEIIFVVLAVSIAYTPFFVRITRSVMLSIREIDYVASAKCVGNSNARIIFRHLLPNCISASMVQACLAVGWAIMDVAGLSFLGLGIQPPTPEWGSMVRDGISGIVSREWWIYFFPGAAIAATVLGFNLLGDALRDILGVETR